MRKKIVIPEEIDNLFLKAKYVNLNDRILIDLKESDLEKQGRHPFLGMTTLREMIKMLYIHNMTHYRDMKKVLK